MIQRAGYDLLRVGLRLVWQLWPVWMFWWSWSFASDAWLGFLRTFPSSQPGTYVTLGYRTAYSAWPSAALLGPVTVMAVGIALHRGRVGSRAMAFAGILGLIVTTGLTGWPEIQRLWPYVGAPGVSSLAVLNAFEPAHGIAVIAGLFAAFLGFCVATRARQIGSRGAPSLLRGTSDNLAMRPGCP